jgi:hypothetical protein
VGQSKAIWFFTLHYDINGWARADKKDRGKIGENRSLKFHKAKELSQPNERRSMTRHPVGLYFLGDDGVYDWAVTLLHSLRTVANDLRVYCVPFSDRIERLGRLENRYNFSILDDPSLAELDEIGREVFGKMTSPPPLQLVGTFRKIYTFWGPLDRFLYTDADVVILDGFTDLFERAMDAEATLMYAHSDIQQVYRPGPLRNKMMQEYATKAINTGLWTSKAGTFTLEQVRDLATEASPLADEFCGTLEQPFLNYCLDVSRVPMEPFNSVMGACAWAGTPRPLRTESDASGRLQVRRADGSLVPAIHWAGYQLSNRMPHYRIYRHFRITAMSSQERIRLFWRELSEARSCVLLHRACRWLSQIPRTK